MNDNTVMPATNDARKGDVVAPTKEKGWFYTDTVKDHFFHPKNFLEDEAGYGEAYLGMVGSPACVDATEAATKAGYSIFGKPLTYARPDQHIRRKIVILVKN